MPFNSTLPGPGLITGNPRPTTSPPLGVQLTAGFVQATPGPAPVVPKPIRSEPPLTSHEKVDALRKIIVAGGIVQLPLPTKPAGPAIPPAVNTAGVLLYNLTGLGAAEGHLKANPIALAAWYALPVPFGNQDPRIFGLSRDYQLGDIPLRPALIFDEVSTFVREELLHGHSAAVAAAEEELARQERLRAEFRNRISGLPTDQLLGLATTTVLPVEYRGLQFFRGEQQALLDVLAERGYVRGPGNTLIPPKPAGPGDLPSVNPKDP